MTKVAAKAGGSSGIPETRLRRWWLRFADAVRAMETSEFDLLVDRIEYLEQRVRRLELLQRQQMADGPRRG